ncbi:hypothetical protein AALO_G00160670 [Alosa alosa]|uniref:Cytochrome P450 n=1 Tax=Alosa alosa TaxID=278164 RepID=A0AAV6GD56_9TELE|nr:hypothetical protein AALO_G00160670 [Alosa alosa]
MSESSMLLLAGLVMLLLLLAWRRRGARGLPLPPGPTGLPLLGNLPQVDKRAPFKTFMKWSKQYGPVMTVNLGPVRIVTLSGYQAVKEALVDQADDFTGRAPIPLLNRVVNGYGLAISNGERWRQLRRFTLSTLRDFGMGRKKMDQWIQEESQHLLESLRQTKLVPFDPTFFLSRAVSNVICALVFGQRFSYDDTNFLRLLEIISDSVRFGSTPWGQLYNIFPRKRACVGESLARMELLLFLVSIVQQFHLSTPGGPSSIDIKPEFSSFGNIPRQYELIVIPVD